MSWAIRMIDSREKTDKASVGDIKSGDVIRFHREASLHYGIYVGSSMVVHLKKSTSNDYKFGGYLFSSVCMDKLEFIQGKINILKLNHFDPKFGIFQPQRPETVVYTALQELDSRTNCTDWQFVEKCVYGFTLSLSNLFCALTVGIFIAFLHSVMNFANFSSYAMIFILAVLIVIFRHISTYITGVFVDTLKKNKLFSELNTSNCYLKLLQGSSYKSTK